jgi:hypothetical protein
MWRAQARSSKRHHAAGGDYRGALNTGRLSVGLSTSLVEKTGGMLSVRFSPPWRVERRLRKGQRIEEASCARRKEAIQGKKGEAGQRMIGMEQRGTVHPYSTPSPGQQRGTEPGKQPSGARPSPAKAAALRVGGRMGQGSRRDPHLPGDGVFLGALRGRRGGPLGG